MKKTKVFFDAFPICTERKSGIGHLVEETIRGLDLDEEFNNKYELILVAPKKGLQNIKKLGYKNAKTKSTLLKGRIWNALVIYNLMPPVDIFLGKGIYVFGNYTTWPLIRSKSITYIHDLNFLENPGTVKPKTNKVLVNNINIWANRASRVATISEFSKKEIIKKLKISENKVEVIYCGVDLKKFYPKEKETINKVKSKYGIVGEYIIFLSNIEPRKNVERLLDAYSLLTPILKSKYALVLIGADGWLNESIKQKIIKMVNSDLNVIWPDVYVPDEDLPALLSGAKALVHPALYEGFGIPPLEAMACGTIPIVGNTSSLPEVVGDCGAYVNPLDTEDICSNITSVLEGRIKYDSKALLQRASNFTWDKSATRLKSIINDLVEYNNL